MRRRDLLAAAAAAPLLLAAPAPARAAGTETDADLFATALELAMVTALAYREGARSGRLDPALTRTATRFAALEAVHAAALRTGLEALGGGEPPRPTAVRGLNRVEDQAGFVSFAIGLEELAIAGYLEAIRRLTDPGLLRTMASIMAADGEQLAVLRRLAGGSAPVTRAFETGGR